MTIKTGDDRHLWLFFAIAYAFSWVFWIPGALAAHGVPLPAGLADFLAGPLNPAAFGPFFAAFLLTFLQYGGKGVLQLLKQGIDFRFRKVWLLAILILPFVVFGGAVLIGTLVGSTPLDLSVVSNPPYAVVAFFVILFTGGPLQEEFGWRGYALPRLQSRFNALLSSVILGLLWWLWHLPAVFIPGRFMTNDFLMFLALSAVITPTAILFTWVYNNTGGSVLAALLLHTSMNWSIWLFRPGMRMDWPTVGFMIAFVVAAAFVIARIWGAARLNRGQG